MISFAQLNEQIGNKTKVWVYQFKKVLDNKDLLLIQETLNQFTASWESHGNKLNAKAFVVEKHFILISVNQNGFEASGCSIDKSVEVLRSINQHYNLDLFNRLTIAVIKNANVLVYSKAEIQQELIAGKLSSEDFYIDLSITDGSQMQSLLKPIHQSWFYPTLTNA